MGKKKGQITVYIIIGIIALVSVSVFLYIRSVKVEAPITYRPTIEQIPVEADPIRTFVASCVAKAAEEGLKKIADYGGYTSPEKMKATVNPLIPTEGDAVQFSPGSELVVPYWWYMKSSNTCEKQGRCEFDSKRPNLYRGQGEPSIEGQLDEYVNENLKLCLKDFVDLAEFGFEISEAGDVDTKTVVTQESVAFLVKYPLVARKAGVTYHINEYFVDIPLNLKEIYELATSLTNLEANYTYLENYILNIISLYGGVDKNALPPLSGISFLSGGGVTWTKSDVQERAMQILTSYIPMLRVTNTRNFRILEIPEGTSHRRAKMMLWNYNMHVPLVDEEHYRLEVYFNYLNWWNPFFNLNCVGELCRPDSGSGIGSMFSIFIQRYLFNYDISLPVLVTIVNPRAFNRRGYSFKFFLEANVRDNRGVAENMTAPFEALPILAAGTMLCDSNKRVSPEINLTVTDRRVGTPIEGAYVQYKCGTEQCDMGRTDTEGNLVAKYPICVGGQLQVEKPGYHGALVGMSTDYMEPFAVSVRLEPYRKKDIKIRKYNFVKTCVPYSGNGENITSCGWQLRDTPIALSNYETAIITMERIPDFGESPFVAAADYSGDRTVEDASKDVLIIPGNYDIRISTTNKNHFIIPEDEVCTDILGIEIDCTTIDAIEFGETKPFYSGGAELNNVHLSAISMDTNDIIVFYAITIGLDIVPERNRKHEDLGHVGMIDKYSIMYRNLLKPTYEKKPEYLRIRENITMILE